MATEPANWLSPLEEVQVKTGPLRSLCVGPQASVSQGNANHWITEWRVKSEAGLCCHPSSSGVKCALWGMSPCPSDATGVHLSKVTSDNIGKAGGHRSALHLEANVLFQEETQLRVLLFLEALSLRFPMTNNYKVHRWCWIITERITRHKSSYNSRVLKNIKKETWAAQGKVPGDSETTCIMTAFYHPVFFNSHSWPQHERQRD